MMRYLAILLTIGLFLTACDESSAENNQAKIKYQSEKCTGNITVELGPYTFELPRRSGISLDIKDGKSLHFLHQAQPDAPCEKTHFEDVRTINLVPYPVPLPFDVSMLRIGYISTKSELPPSNYQTIVRVLEKRKKEGSLEEKILSNGISFFDIKGGKKFYILSLDVIPTLSEEPVSLICSNTSVVVPCGTVYALPNGLFLSYKIEGNPDTLIPQMQRINSYVSSLIINGLAQGEK